MYTRLFKLKKGKKLSKRNLKNDFFLEKTLDVLDQWLHYKCLSRLRFCLVFFSKSGVYGVKALLHPISLKTFRYKGSKHDLNGRLLSIFLQLCMKQQDIKISP